MKELTIEEKAKRYDEAIERAKYWTEGKCVEDFDDSPQNVLNFIFPETKESEDEKIRKWIRRELESKYVVDNIVNNKMADKAFAWLEKQGEHKVEPKFKVGDFIINEYGFIMQIDRIDSDVYVYHVLDDNRLLKHDITKTDKSCHLWTIRDAKDGDILANDGGSICIFDGTVEEGIYPFAHCGLTRYGFESYDGKLPFTHDGVHPATQEQRNLLFTKMKEAGYEWDAEKKELREIEQESAWSEEDEHCIELLLPIIDSSSLIPKNRKRCKEFLESLKERVQPQPTK